MAALGGETLSGDAKQELELEPVRDLLKLLADGNRCVSESTAPYVILLQTWSIPKLGLLARVVRPADCVPELPFCYFGKFRTIKSYIV